MAIENAMGHYLVVEGEHNGHLIIKVYESEGAFQAHQGAPTPATEPDKTMVHLGEGVISDAKAGISSLDGMTFEEREKQLYEDLLLETLTSSYKSMQRTKWDKSDWAKKTK